MRNYLKIMISLSILLLGVLHDGKSQCCASQPEGIKATVYLHNGSEFVGIIKSYDEEEGLVLDIGYDDPLHFKAAGIKKIVQQGSAREYKFMHNQHQYHISGGVILNENYRGTSITAGYLNHISPIHGLGVETGINNFIAAADEIFIPTALSYRLYSGTRKNEMFLHMAAGYSFVLAPDQGEDGNVSGGLFLNPRVGVRLGLSRDLALSIHGGFKLQNVNYSQRGFEWEWERKVQYRRIEIGAGIVF